MLIEGQFQYLEQSFVVDRLHKFLDLAGFYVKSLKDITNDRKLRF